MESIQWQAFIKSCLDILRNGQSKFDGLKAINEFITLITLKLVENRISDFDENDDSNDNNIKIGLDCKITYLYNTFCKTNKSDKKKDLDKKTNELFDLLYNINRNYDIEDEMDDNLKHVGQIRKLNDKKECIIVRFNKYTTQLNKLTDNINDFKTITTFDKSHSDDVQKLIIKIHETFDNIDMTTFNYDAFGNAYEKIIAEELGNNSKRNGQYFTKRELIELIINELDIKSNHLCYDPACGTGGFLLSFANKFKDNYNFIKNNIYGREYLYEVYKILNFNILANNCDKAFQNITNGDSIRDDHYHKQVMNKFDIVGANPPFGVSIDTIPTDYPIKVKNSVACFLQHIYFSLKDGGKAGVIIDRGILNNGTDKKNCWEGKLRKFLLEKTNIYKIINLPNGIFKHTNFATSVVFFVKGTPTKEVKYIEGYFKKEDKGKGDKKLYLGEEKVISIKDIIDKNYSLKHDDYFKEQVVVLEEDQDKWVKLGDVVKFDIGGTPSRKETKYYNGNHLWISVSELNNTIINDTKEKITDFAIKESSVKLIKKDSILMSFKLSIGKMGIAGKEMYCNEAIMFFKHDNDITNRYLYYYLLLNDLSKYASGQIGAGSLNKTSLYNILIPNLSLDHQETIVKFLDEIYTDVDIDETIKYYKDKPIFNLLIEKRYEDFKDIIDYQPRIKFITSELDNIKKYKNMMVRSIFNKYRKDCETKKLGEIIEIKNYKPIKIEKSNNTGKYPFYNCSILGHLWSDEYQYEDDVLLMNKTNGTGKCRIYHNNGKFSISGGVIVFKTSNNKFFEKLLNYNTKIISEKFKGGDKKNINLEDFKNIIFSIPSLEKQQEIINIIENTESPESHYNKYSKILKEELDNIMEIIGNMCILSNNNLELDENSINDNESEVDLEIEIEDSEE
jgi:type I restriction-modification system DNA methylase subunit